ncbi:MAG: MATE family efflux transporter [Verrucomicrobia bacterium]|nr:MATE family efflux transporter [Verrucomicrobiota bacterium]MBV8485372.1 MATE family efflux transporter [Verrucomicrobiota bacterium]
MVGNWGYVERINVNRRFQPSHYHEIFNVAWPVGLEAVFQSSFSLIDQVIVGSLGASAVAAVGLSNNLSFILTLLYAAIGTGSGAFIAQAYGRQDLDEVSKIAAIGQTVAASLGVCSSIPLILFPSPILRLVGAQEELVKIASVYLQLFAASAPLTVMSAVTTATFRSMSDSRTPMAITMASVCLNTLLALLLVLGMGGAPHLGVAGAGLATLISQGVRAVVLVTVLYSVKKGMRWYWPVRSIITRIGPPLFKVTYPIALSEMLWGTSTFAYVVIFTRIGTGALASSQIVTTMENLFILAASGLAPAAVATVGQALGSDATENAQRQARRVLHVALVAGLLFTALLAGVSFLLPVIYPRIDRQVLNLAFWGILIVAAVQPAKTVNSVLGTGTLPSGGDTKFVLLSHVVSSYAVGLPIGASTALLLGWGPLTTFGSRALEELLKSALLFARYRTRAWQRELGT